MNELAEIVKAEPLEGMRVRLTFSDGFVKIVDVGNMVRGSVFESEMSDPNFFDQVQIYPYGDGIFWPNEFDLCPESLRYHTEGVVEEPAFSSK